MAHRADYVAVGYADASVFGWLVNMWENIVEILIYVIVFIAGLFLRSFLPSYFTEKGKNLATKEDIGHITEEVEKIRMQYDVQMETIRSAIAEVRTEKSEYLHEQRACLLKFCDLSIELFYEKLTINFADFDSSDVGKEYKDFRNSTFELISSLIKSYQRIVIYFGHEERIRADAEALLNLFLKARTVIKDHLTGISLAAFQNHQTLMSGDVQKTKAAYQEFAKMNSDYRRALYPIITTLQELLKNYLTELNKFLRPNESPQLPDNLFSEVL
ncbi:MAG: hypothetical protein AB1564_00440 [Chloroflexota bacterium]